MRKEQSIEGQKFNRLTAIRFVGDKVCANGTIKHMWECECDCGNKIVTNSNALKTGNTKSCGCLKMERLLARNLKHGGDKAGIAERLYWVWKGVRSRCLNPKNPSYAYYGGRGIALCKEWNDYAVFREWALTNGYNENARHGECTLDRIDNNKGYSPSNCRWANMFTQANNTGKNRVICFKGESKTASEWARDIGISANSLYIRLKNGWSIEEALTTPPLKCNRKYAKVRR